MTNLFIIALPFVIAFNLLLGAFVLFTNVRRLANQVFAVLSLVIALWLSCQFIGSTMSSEVWLAFWIRQSCAVSLFMPLFFHLLRGAVVQSDGTFIGLLRRSWPWAVAVVAVAVMCQTRYFLVGARLSTAAGAIAEPLYGPGFSAFVGFWIAFVTVLVWSHYRALAKTDGVCRMELQIVALGTFLALVPGVLLVLVIPLLTGSSQSARFTPMTVVIWHGVIGYGIATRHIMGVGEFLRRIIIYLILAVSLTALYVFVFQCVEHLPLAAGDLKRTGAHGLAALAVALTLAPANASLRRGVARLFDDAQAEISHLLYKGGGLARSMTTVDALCRDFASLLRESLDLTYVAVYLRDGSHFTLHTRLGEADGIAQIRSADPLVRALCAERYPLLRDVLRRAGGTPLKTHAERALARLGAEAAVALLSNNGLVGFLLLGRRLNGRVFGRHEEDALMILGDQMGIAIENASLYTRLQDGRIYNEVLLDNLVTGVIAADRGGCVTVCNREAQRILRLDASAPVIGHPVAVILPAEIWDEVHASLLCGKTVRDRDLVLNPQTADEQAVRFATALFGVTGSVASGVLLVVQDTSAIRKLEEQIRRSDRLASIGTLAAGMAHEIKNPLVCLKTFAQLLPSRYDDPDFRDTFTPLLGNEVERINAIVSQLLNLSRPVKPTLVPMSLHAALDVAWQLAAQQIKVKGLTFDRQYHATQDRLLGDERLLSQVFLNLLLNGIDAMEQGGTLTLSTETVSSPEPALYPAMQNALSCVEVRVTDTGRGINPEDRLRIFDPFYTTKATGTGLGLSVAHGIVLEHRGIIDVESVPEKGTCFRILFPLLPPGGNGDGVEKGAA